MDAGVVDDISAARLQLRHCSQHTQPATAMGFEAPGRSGLEVRVEETTFGSTEHCVEATRDAAGAPDARPCRHVLPDRCRVVDLYHLRGCVSLLRWKESDRALSEPGAARSNFQFHLSLRLQLHYRHGRTCAEAQCDQSVRDLAADHHRAWGGLPRG